MDQDTRCEPPFAPVADGPSPLNYPPAGALGVWSGGAGLIQPSGRAATPSDAGGPSSGCPDPAALPGAECSSPGRGSAPPMGLGGRLFALTDALSFSTNVSSLPSTVLGGRRSQGDAGVHDSSLPQAQSLRLQMGVDLLKQSLPQFVPLKKVTEVQNRGLVGQGVRQPQPSEPPDRFGLVEQILHAWIAEVVEQLHAVNPQHHRQWVRPTALSGLGVDRPDALLQPFPGNQAAPSAR